MAMVALSACRYCSSSSLINVATKATRKISPYQTIKIKNNIKLPAVSHQE
jgi:hypothetical protein